MQGHLQFVTTPTADTPGTALTLSFADKKYLFGHAHEGLQRAALQHTARFTKIKDYFLTGRTEWTNTGGLLGLILSVAESVKGSTAAKVEAIEQKAARAKQREEEEENRIRSGKKKMKKAIVKTAVTQQQEPEDPTLRIRSAPNLRHTLAAARSFIFKQGMPIEVEEFTEEHSQPSTSGCAPDFQDDNIMVWALPISIKSKHDESGSVQLSPGRKRRLDDYIENDSGSAAETARFDIVQRNRDLKADDTRKFLVKEMFQSQWQHDNLFESSLHKVTLPAQIFVRDPSTGKVSKYSGPLPGKHSQVPNIPVLVREPWPGAVVKTLPAARPSSVAVSYVVKGHTQRGRFRAGEAKRLGVPAGPLFRELTIGKSVKAADGTTVTPEMVLEPSRKGGGFVLLDVPSVDYLPVLLSHIADEKADLLRDIKVYIWLLGPGVSEEASLSLYMEKRSDVEHIVSSSDVCDNVIAMTSAAGQSARLHVIDPSRFPSLQNSSATSKDQHGARVDSHYLTAKGGMKIQVMPEAPISLDATYAPFNSKKALKDLPPEVANVSRQIVEGISSEQSRSAEAQQGLRSPEAEIVFLGTGSMLPSLHRNVSATLLRVPGQGSYLMDCGENTLGQLQRMYSKAELHDILKDLKLIWISHLHADHHLGTVSVIRAWYKAVHQAEKTPIDPALEEGQVDRVKKLLSGRNLFVVSNPLMARFLREYSSVEDYGFAHVIPLSTSSAFGSSNTESRLSWDDVEVGFSYHPTQSSGLRFAMREATGLSQLAYCSVAHCWGANAVSLTFPSGFKFSYSGDCRPSRRFASIGKDSTVLVHEATFDDQLQADARAKRHSTISEAVGIGAAMRARRVLLTHFSQRFAKIPTMDDLDRRGFNLESAEDVSESNLGSADGPVDVPPIETGDSFLADARQTPNRSQPSNRNGTNAKLGTDIVAGLDRDMKIGVAFDHMRVKVKDIMHLEKFNPILRQLYREDEELSESIFENQRRTSPRPKKAGKEVSGRDQATDEEARMERQMLI